MLIVMGTLTRIAWTCIAVSLLVAGVAWFFNRAPSDISASQRASREDTPIYSLNDQVMGAAIQALLGENADLEMSISIVDLQNNDSYHYGDTDSYMAASISKLLTATLFLHKVELGQATLAEMIGVGTARSQLEKLIVESDNTAWHALNAKLTLGSLQEYAKTIGMRSYDVAANTVSSDDIASLLSKLARGKLLDNHNTDFLLSLMHQANMRNYIVAGISEGATAYHKTGYLADRVHDAAIIKKGDRSYVLVIFSKASGNYDFGRGATLFGNITAVTSDAFFGSANSGG
ncbi:MAG: serine hydrolase [Patescibacteria group bacterium]